MTHMNSKNELLLTSIKFRLVPEAFVKMISDLELSGALPQVLWFPPSFNAGLSPQYGRKRKDEGTKLN